MDTNKLKKKILSTLGDGDIASLYLLEQEANDLLSEDELLGYYRNILDLALERLTDVLEAKELLKMDNVQDFATIRALYEYAIQHYHAKKLQDASALFEILSGISDNKDFSYAMKIHTKATQQDIDLESFLEHYADTQKVQEKNSFYISDFTIKVQKLLEGTKGEL